MRQSQKSNFKTGFKLAPLLWLILLLPACDFKDYQEYENDNNEWERKKRAAANSHKIPYGEYFQKEVVNPDTGSRLRFMKPSHFEDVVELEAFEPLTVETNSFSLLQSSPVEYLSRSLKIKFVNFHQSDLPEGAKVVISPAKKASLTSDDIKELYVYAQYTDKDANQVTQLIKVTDPDFDGYLISTKYLGNGYYQLVRVNGGESAILTPQKTAKKPEFTYVTGGDGKTRSPEGSSTKKETAAASEELSSAESLAPPPCTHDKQVGCITTVTYKSSKSFYTNCASSGEEGCIANSAFVAQKKSLTEACTADGQTDCVSRLPLVLVDPVFVDASVIKVGSTIAGVGGTLANCNSDGSSGCVTTSDYPSANLAAIDEYDIRAGSVFGGVAGKFRLCKGYADSAKLDKGDVGLDIYDYISIRSLFYGFGKALSADHDDFTADPIADFFSCVDDDNWVKGGVESAAMNGDCNDALDECTLYDKRTKLYVSRSVGTNNAVMWAAAVSHCSGLDYGGFDDWRLPTVREMLDLQGSNIAQFIQNFDSVFMKFKPDSLYWTLDAHPTNGEYSVIPIALPTLESKHKSDHTDGAICVRQDI